MSCWTKIKWIAAASLALAALRPAPLLACAACYGQSDSPLARGMNWGIVTLLGVVVGVLAGISLFFVHVSRRSAAASGAEESTAAAPPAKDA